MLQPSKFSRSPLELQNTDLQSILSNTALGRLWRTLANLLRLPNDLTSFLLFVVVLSVLCGGLILHIHLSSRILQARLDIGEQKAAFEAIEQRNSEIVWRINQSIALDNIRQRATALGYVDMPDHQYISANQIKLATGTNQLENNTLPHFASSPLNTEAPNSAYASTVTSTSDAISDGAPATVTDLNGTSIMANSTGQLTVAGQPQFGFSARASQWWQQTRSWLPLGKR